MYALASGQTTAEVAAEPGRRVNGAVYACKAPYIPERRRNINNASLWEDGCSAPA